LEGGGGGGDGNTTVGQVTYGGDEYKYKQCNGLGF
jgi:hypothetical protein